jgi:acetate kinase
MGGTETPGEEPDVVLACAGDTPTLETMAAGRWLREARAGASRARRQRGRSPEPLLPREHPHGIPTSASSSSSRSDTTSCFSFHGYASAIHQLLHARPNPTRFHVRGYKEEGTTTTPFDMVVLNQTSRYHLVMEALHRARVELAPLHVPPALALLDAARAGIDRPQVVCVDTAFHTTIPEFATTYAVPAHWRTWGVRRYGFHGLSYAWSSRRSAELLQRPADGMHVVIAHIGAGVSACAIRNGRSVDTSMGFTPLEGAVMASRSGTVDPGALLWLQDYHGLTVGAMTRSLEHLSGLFGLCGKSDMREVEDGAGKGDSACILALDVYVHVLCRVIGGLVMSLDRLDALVFTGGVGEHSALIRGRVCSRLNVLGLPETLLPAEGDAVIGPSDHSPAVVVVTAREDAEMAREARRVLAA